jgi:hypothetical protein
MEGVSSESMGSPILGAYGIVVVDGEVLVEDLMEECDGR